MPKISKRSRTVTKKPNRLARKRPEYKLVLEKTEPEFRSYPSNTWAILRPVDNAQLPFIFLTESFNCLAKSPDSTPNHHVIQIIL